MHGEDIFENFEDEFLRFNLEKHLILRTINPLLLFSRKGRTESAINYYQKFLFHDATFADLINPDRPMIIINASDLGRGIRFSFIQEYFDLLCSDLSSFPVAEAVAASSAVPVLFNPIVVKNFDACAGMQLMGTKSVQDAQQFYRDENLPVLISQLESYAEKDKRKFIHFVDGGITDNLGLRALSDIMAVGAVSSLQLRRNDEDSIIMLKQELDLLAEALATPEQPVSTYFINVNLQDAEDPKILDFLNRIPTSFALSDEQVDSLIESGQVLLRENPEFQKLIRELNGQ